MHSSLIHKSYSFPDLIVHEIQMESMAKAPAWSAGMCRVQSFPKSLVSLADDDDSIKELATCLATPIENKTDGREVERPVPTRIFEIVARHRRSSRKKRSEPTLG
jgi:hypothetical protein